MVVLVVLYIGVLKRSVLYSERLKERTKEKRKVVVGKTLSLAVQKERKVEVVGGDLVSRRSGSLIVMGPRQEKGKRKQE